MSTESSCKDCKVERGYRPIVDYVALCPLHAAAPELLNALRQSAIHAHTAGGSHAPNFVKFEECQKAECIAAREAIRKAEGK